MSGDLSTTDTLERADDLLRRLSEWDMLYVPKDGRPAATADAPYWQGEIARTRVALARLRQDSSEPTRGQGAAGLGARAPRSAPSSEAAAFERWCDEANYASDDPDAPHTEAFYGGYRAAASAAGTELRDALREAVDTAAEVRASVREAEYLLEHARSLLDSSAFAAADAGTPKGADA